MTKQEQVDRIIKNEILTLANEMHEALQKIDFEVYCDAWVNTYNQEDDTYKEIMQFFIVTDWLAEKLSAIGEPVALDFYGLAWWGRTCCGQAIECDGTIQEIVEGLS